MALKIKFIKNMVNLKIFKMYECSVRISILSIVTQENELLAICTGVVKSTNVNDQLPTFEVLLHVAGSVS